MTFLVVCGYVNCGAFLDVRVNFNKRGVFVENNDFISRIIQLEYNQRMFILEAPTLP